MCVCLSVCDYDNLNTIAGICFLLESCHADWRKSRTRSHVNIHRPRSRSFLKGSRSLGKTMNCSVAGNDISSPTASFIARIGKLC